MTHLLIKLTEVYCRWNSALKRITAMSPSPIMPSPQFWGYNLHEIFSLFFSRIWGRSYLDRKQRKLQREVAFSFPHPSFLSFSFFSSPVSVFTISSQSALRAEQHCRQEMDFSLLVCLKKTVYIGCSKRNPAYLCAWKLQRIQRAS